MSLPRRVGLLGGTFDPVHRGHLAMARAAERASQLERIYFVPAPQPWHRRQAPVAGYADRYAMLALALAQHPRWMPLAVPDAGHRPTYSIDQVRWIREHGWGERICFILGADAFAGLPGWHRWRELLRSCDWLVLARGQAPGKPTWEALRRVVPPALVRHWDARGVELAGGRRMQWLPRFADATSATSTRRWLARGGGPGTSVDPETARGRRPTGGGGTRPAQVQQGEGGEAPGKDRPGLPPVPAAVARYARRARIYQNHG